MTQATLFDTDLPAPDFHDRQGYDGWFTPNTVDGAVWADLSNRSVFVNTWRCSLMTPDAARTLARQILAAADRAEAAA